MTMALYKIVILLTLVLKTTTLSDSVLITFRVDDDKIVRVDNKVNILRIRLWSLLFLHINYLDHLLSLCPYYIWLKNTGTLYYSI